MTDSHHEPSYYEIALTNRQVLIAFVVILGSVLGAFLSGVWLGRKGAVEAAASARITAALEGDVAGLPDLQFFDETAPGAPPPAAATSPPPDAPPAVRRPDLSELLRKPDPSTTLAEDVTGGSPAPPAAAPPEDAEPVDEAPPPPPSPAVDASPPPPARAGRTPPPEPTEGFVVQVFSTRDEVQARRVLRKLRDGDHPAYLSPTVVDGQTMFRVRIGPYGDRAAAEKVGETVKASHRFDTWIVAAGN